MYQGVIVPLITPLTAEGAVCAASIERLIESVRPAAAGLVPTLSSGEGWRLTLSQWRDMVLWTRRFARGLPVLAGIELPTTGEVLERAQLVRDLQHDVLLARAAGADRARVLAAVARVERDDDQPVGLRGGERGARHFRGRHAPRRALHLLRDQVAERVGGLGRRRRQRGQG